MSNSFEFDDLIKFSQNLLDNKEKVCSNNFQCIYRTIISRVYYSAFHHTKYWLEINHNFKSQELNLATGKIQNKKGLSEHVQVYKELRKLLRLKKSLNQNFIALLLN